MKYLFLTLYFFILTFAQAQTEWTLQQCVDYGLKNNIALKQSQLDADLANNSLLQARGNFLPNLNANANHGYNFGQTIDRYTNQFASERVQSNNFFLSSSVTLFSGLQNYNNLKQSEISALASKYDTDKMRNDISLQIAGGYLQVLYAQEQYENATNQLNITKQQVARTQKLFDAGSISKEGLLTVQAQVATEELSQVNAQNQIDLSYLNLRQLMYLDAGTPLVIAKPNLNLPAEAFLNTTSAQIYSQALTTQPDVKSAELRVQSSDKQVAAARGGLSPNLSVTGSIGTGYSGLRKDYSNPQITGQQTIGYTTTGDEVYQPVYSFDSRTTPFADQIKDNVNKSISFNLSVPLFNGFQTHANVSRAKINQQSAQLNLLNTQNQLLKTIQQSYADASAASKKYAASQKNVEALQETFKYTQQRFDVGMINSYDFNASKNNLLKAQSDLLQAKYDFIFKVKILDFYQGKSLSF